MLTMLIIIHQTYYACNVCNGYGYTALCMEMSTTINLLLYIHEKLIRDLFVGQTWNSSKQNLWLAKLCFVSCINYVTHHGQFTASSKL